MYIAYIYDTTNTVIAQIEEILDFETKHKINGISTGSFWLFHTNPYCKRDILKKYRRVRVNMIVWNTESNLFDGVIRWFDADIDKATVQLSSFEHYFERRILHQDYTYTGIQINTILADILDDINTRYETNITLASEVTTTTSKTYKNWETFLKVLQDLAGNWFEFIIKDMVLIFKETIWIDRTSWENFVEYRYDVNEPEDRSIDQINMKEDGKEFSNGVIWKSWATYTELDDPTSITEFWLIETSFTNSGDDANATQTYLDEHKDAMSEFDIDAISRDFFEADLWDMVKVYVYVGNDLMFFDGEMKVIEKSYTSWDLPKITFWLSNTVVKSKDVLEQIVDIQNRVKGLELK